MSSPSGWSTWSVGLLVLAGWVGAQSPRPIPYPLLEEPAFAQAIAAKTRTREGRPGEAYWTNRAFTSISAELDPVTARLNGHARIVYENHSPERLTTLPVHLRQNLHQAASVRNRPVEITGGVTLESVTVDGEDVREGSGRGHYRMDGTVMTIRPEQPVASGGKVIIEVRWSFTVPRAGQAPRMGHEDHHVFFLGYWYPQMAVFDDVEGWVAEPYMGNGEFYMGYGSYDVAITVPAGWIVVATGTLQNAEDVLTEETQSRLAKARTEASVVRVVTKAELGKATKASSDGKATWKFQADDVRDFAFATSDRYLWDATQAAVEGPDGTRRDEPCLIHAVYEANARGWQRTAEYAKHTIEFVSKLVHPYPWPHMTVCEGIVGGGMEFPMMTDIGVTGSANGIQDVTAHEIIHMWFPMMVGTNEKQRSWMDEGLTEFVTSLTGADFWKSQRPIQEAYAQYRQQARLHLRYPAMHHTDMFPEASRMNYYFVAYTKTAAVMHQLESLLGPEHFWKALREYVSDWKGKHAYHHDLFNTFERVSGRDLDWYFRTWFYETWLLDQRVASVEDASDDRCLITIEDVGLAPAPSKLRITFLDGRREEAEIPVSHWLSGARTKVLEVSGRVTVVELDPERRSLDIDPKNDTWRR